jgi:hypothetical protein
MSVHPAVRRLRNELKQFRAENADLKEHVAAEKKQLAAITALQEQHIDEFGTRDPALDARFRRVDDRFDGIIAKDRRQVAAERKDAKHDLKAAQPFMKLKTTNRIRGALGLEALDKTPVNLKTVAGCAQALLNSKNVSFWSGLSTGSDEKNLERLADGKKALVPAKGTQVMPKLSMMRALVAMSKRGKIQINALTGGVHSTNSNHYRGTAVDLSIHTGNSGMIERVARKFGGIRNFERTHIHLDF